MSVKTLIWVIAMTGCYGYEGKYYGPSSKPIQIPEGLAQTLGLEEIDEPQPDEEALTGGSTALETEKQKLEADLKTAKDALETEQKKSTALETEKQKLEADLQAAKDALASAPVTGFAMPTLEELEKLEVIGKKGAAKVLEFLSKRVLVQAQT
jgi:hypothetical protein